MKTWSSCRIALAAMMLLTPLGAAFSQVASAPGATRVAPWKDDKKAVFMLMFDDSVPSDFKTVIPELQKRGMIGTFYVNPGSGQWKGHAQEWEKTIPSTGMVYANHTMTHKGYQDLAGADQEIGKCTEAILQLQPGKDPHLLSYGVPGGCPLKITKEEYQGLLTKYHLVERPDFNGHGATIHLKDADAILKVADNALATGGEGHVVFHGVGGDWLVFPADQFVVLLDGLATRQDLWITDHISEYKYATERSTAKVQIVGSTDQQIQLSLSSSADAQLFDYPLTLITTVPSSWQNCEITQGTKTTTVAVRNNEVRFEAVPGNQPITLKAVPLQVK